MRLRERSEDSGRMRSRERGFAEERTRERERCGCWKTCMKEEAHRAREKTKSERTRECKLF